MSVEIERYVLVLIFTLAFHVRSAIKESIEAIEKSKQIREIRINDPVNVSRDARLTPEEKRI